MKTILLLTGSPRRNGNTDRIASAFQEGASESGHRVIRFDVGRMDIHPCMDCRGCAPEGGECPIADDMAPVYEALDQADILALATPVYCHGFSAQIKAAIDRMATAMGNSHVKGAALLAVCAGETEDAFVLEKHFEAIIRYNGWSSLGSVLQGGVYDIGDIAGMPGIEAAHVLGKDIEIT